MDRQISECHRRLIRTGLGARITNLVCEAAMATSTRIISIRAAVRHGRDQHIVAVNVDICRSRAMPGKVHYLSSLDLRALRGQRDA